jgi:sugar/nucleoside kinase (ribokinase family)
VAVARAGGAVNLVGAVGEDGAWLVRDLEGYGVSTADISLVQVRPVSLENRTTCRFGVYPLATT